MNKRNALILVAVSCIVTVGLLLIWHWLMLALFGVFAWRLLLHRSGYRRAARSSGRGFWELAFGVLGGWMMGRRSNDVLKSAVRNGGEIQIHVTPGSRYKR